MMSDARSWSRVPEEWRSIVSETEDSVLLETSKVGVGNRRSLLFTKPVRILSALKSVELPDMFRQLEDVLAEGFHVAGFVGYECGYHFQDLNYLAHPSSEMPLAWFGVYREPLVHHHHVSCEENEVTLPALDPSEDFVEVVTKPDLLTTSEDGYCAAIKNIKEYIQAGDTYQVNFTDVIDARTSSSAYELFASLSRRQPVAYSAFLNIDGNHILSFSPELFFQVDDGRIITRPMKGTMARGRDSAEDVEAAARLRNDEKNRAEHVMIVDLLRNDLGRICTMGSVQVEDLFSVEKYRTLFQMTSTIQGALRAELKFYDIFKSMFPCGSITGAPKIRTMQIIRELEQRPRGLYTGAIGYISPDRSATFSIAIRTLVFSNGRINMGVGGGIVADSDPHDEYRECLLKANFLVQRQPAFQLFETMLWDREFTFLSSHLDRMESSASYFELPFCRTEITTQLFDHLDGFLPGECYRVKLSIDEEGRASVTSVPYVYRQPTGRVRISPERTSSKDVFLRHKTTRREQYERLYAEAVADGFDEVIFLNEREELTEGAISNIFLLREGRLLTPPLGSGVLPGVYRRHLLETHPESRESVLTLGDLASADGVFLCNSVRGMREVTCPIETI